VSQPYKKNSEVKVHIKANVSGVTTPIKRKEIGCSGLRIIMQKKLRPDQHPYYFFVPSKNTSMVGVHEDFGACDCISCWRLKPFIVYKWVQTSFYEPVL